MQITRVIQARKVVALLMLVAVSLVVPNSRALADREVQWDTPLNLSAKSDHLGWFPEVHADHYGRVHVTWQGEVPGGEGENALYYMVWDGNSWSDTNDLVIAPPTAWTIRSALTSDQRGNLHMIYRRRATIYYEQAPIERAWSASEWVGRKQFSDANVGYICDIAIDSQDILHAIWSEVRGCKGICGDILYRRSLDHGHTWSYPQIVSEGLAYDAGAQLECVGEGGVYIAWDTLSEAGERQGVTLRVSTDAGETWQPPVSFGSADEIIYQGAVGVDGNGQIIVVWHPVVGTGIHYQVSSDDGTTWSEPAEIPGIIARPENTPPYDRYDMVTDSSGTVHLMAVGCPAPDTEPTSLYHCRWDGTKWLKPVLVYNGPSFPEFPSVTLANGNRLHAVWFTRDKLWGQSKWEIWHSAAGIDTPAKTPAPLPSCTPTKAPTMAPTTAPTITATPLPDPTVAGVDWRRNANQPLLVAFLATMILLSSVLVLKQMRRK